MANRDFSAYQQKAIRRFYDNRPDIDRTRLAELVTNLYLADGKKADKLWEKAEETMGRLNVLPIRRDRVMETRDVTLLAKVVEDLEKGRIGD